VSSGGLVSRPDLGAAGNLVRGQLNSEVAKDLWENYMQGKGDVPLSEAQFQALVGQAANLTPIRTDDIPLEDGSTLTRKLFSFTGEFA
jgi:hypothetical protein